MQSETQHFQFINPLLTNIYKIAMAYFAYRIIGRERGTEKREGKKSRGGAREFHASSIFPNLQAQ